MEDELFILVQVQVEDWRIRCSRMCSNFNVSPNDIIGIIAGGQKAMTVAIEGAEDDAEQGAQDLKNIHLQSKDIVVGISASGRTPYVRCTRLCK